MSLSNKLTLDKVDVNGKRVIMRYCRVSPPTQLIGCEINCRLLPNCRVGHDSADLCCMLPKTFCPVMQARRRQTHSQLCVRPSTRLQEVKFSSRFHPCYVPVRRCCMDATDWCALNIRTHRNLYSPLCSIPSVRDEVWGAVDILSIIIPQIRYIPYQAWRDMMYILHTVSQNCCKLGVTFHLQRFSEMGFIK